MLTLQHEKDGQEWHFPGGIFPVQRMTWLASIFIKKDKYLLFLYW